MNSTSDQTTYCSRNNMTEVERDFKRLKVDETDKESVSKAKCNHSNRSSNYFCLKSSPYSPKISTSDKRQSVNGFRRQRLHLTNKSKKMRANDETKLSETKVVNIYKDFSDLRLSCDESVSKSADKDESKQLFFNKEFKFDSIEWRKNFDKKLPKNRKLESHSKKRQIPTFKEDKSCARQAMDASYDASAEELAAYLDEALFLPRKMSFMAEMMYT